MTVSDWGSAGAPGGGSGYAPGFARAASYGLNSQEVHAAQFGMEPFMTPRADGPATQPSTGTAPAPRRATGAAGAAGQGDPLPSAGGGLLNIVGALMSVALVVGLGVWGYKLAVRDVSGVPVVRALEGPMRIQPEDPGGAVAPHQGFAVNDVPADGVSAGPVDSVVLAPPATELAEEDVPAAAVQPVEVTSLDRRPAVQPMPATGSEIDADAAVAEALGLTDIPGVTGFDDAVSAPIEVIPESVPGVVRSPRPRPRPSSFTELPDLTGQVRAVDVVAAADNRPPARPAVAPGPVAAEPAAVVLGREVDPAALDADSGQVQLGTYKTPEAARDQWQVLAEMNPVLFDKRDWTIEQSESGGVPFFRLRAVGFADLDDARGFCAALVAGQGTCIAVID